MSTSKPSVVIYESSLQTSQYSLFKPQLIDKVVNTLLLSFNNKQLLCKTIQRHSKHSIKSQINLTTGIREVSPYELAKEISKRKTLDCDNWTLDDLAEFADMSKYAFQKAFKELYKLHREGISAGPGLAVCTHYVT
jgi:hypothetical protein